MNGRDGENGPSKGREPQDEFLHDLPDPAEDRVLSPPLDPDDADLREVDREGQKELMRHWFFDHYCDPAIETPYETAEGGYIWIWGGPYYADEELQSRFASIVPDDVIDELVEELNRDGGYQWAPVRRDEDDLYDDRFELELETPNDPLSKLKMRLAQALSVLSLHGDLEAVAQLPRMAFGTAISALEAYLWETVAFWAKGNRQVLKGIVSNMPELKDQPIKLGQIFEQHDAIETRVTLYLQNLVWHRWDKVALLLKFGLGIKPPSFKPFEEALVKRHDIVHRSGHDKDGNPVSVSADDARELAATVEAFGVAVYEAILAKILPEDDAGEPARF